MHTWHKPGNVYDRCAVCLAGAVMAKTCNVSRDAWINFNGNNRLGAFSKKDTNKFRALNVVRRGEVYGALRQLGITRPEIMDRNVAPYEHDPQQFKCDMRTIARYLEQEGL